MNSWFGAEVNPSGGFSGRPSNRSYSGNGEKKERTGKGKIGAPQRTVIATSGIDSRAEKQQQGFADRECASSLFNVGRHVCFRRIKHLQGVDGVAVVLDEITAITQREFRQSRCLFHLSSNRRRIA